MNRMHQRSGGVGGLGKRPVGPRQKRGKSLEQLARADGVWHLVVDHFSTSVLGVLGKDEQSNQG